jgi:uncharacterized protein (DUF885 family)
MKTLQRLRAIRRAALNEADQLHHDTVEWQLSLAVQRQAFKEHLQPIGNQSGVQTADGIALTMPFATAARVRQYLARLAALEKAHASLDRRAQSLSARRQG